MNNTDFIHNIDDEMPPEGVLTVTFPPMADGQTGWGVYVAQDFGCPPEPPKQSLYRRIMYRLLMWAHDKTEDLWHWIYAKSRKFAPEPEGLRAGMWDNKPSLGWTGGMVSHNYKVVSVEDED